MCLGDGYVYALDLLYGGSGVLATAMCTCWTCSTVASVSWRRLCVRVGLALRRLRCLGDGYVYALDLLYGGSGVLATAMCTCWTCSTVASVSWRRLCVRVGLALRRLRCLGDGYVYALDLLYGGSGVLATAMCTCWTCSTVASVSWRRLCVRAGLALRWLRCLGDGYVYVLDLLYGGFRVLATAMCACWTCSTVASVSWRRLCVRAGLALRWLPCLGDGYVYVLDLLYGGSGVLATAMCTRWTCSTVAPVSWRRLCVRAGLALRWLPCLGGGYVYALDLL
ncbi:unnamed protein product [Effrenium voratum]|nr:unnamed protein product [Effrenium voratum]